MASRLLSASPICAITMLLFAHATSMSLRSPSARSVSMSVSKRIIGGYPVQKGDSPFLVSLQLVNGASQTTRHFCGASVIMGRFLLTAAHCVNRFVNSPERIKVFLGTLRSGSMQNHDNHIHLEDTEEFRANASAIIQRVLDDEKIMFKRNGEVDSALGKSQPIGTESENESTFDAEFEYKACIKKIIVHENYNATIARNDIAILVLAVEIPDKFKNHVVPISLPTNAMEQEGYPAEGTDCTVYGWGRSHAAVTMEESQLEAIVEPLAKQVNIEVRNDTICRRFHQYFFRYSIEYDNTSLFCAGNIGNSYGGAFKGDSGGPVICGYSDNYYQAGIVSFGSSTMSAYMPGFFTRVTWYEDWIKDVTSKYSSNAEPDPAAGFSCGQ